MASASPEEIALMKQYMAAFNDTDAEAVNTKPTVTPSDPYMDLYIEDYVDASKPYNEPTQYVIPQSIEVKEEPHESVKSIKIYKIMCGSTTLITRMYSHDAAQFIKKSLLDGKAFDTPEVLTILSLGLQYTKSVDTLSSVMQERQKALRKNDYDSAKMYDTQISSKQQEAVKVLKLIADRIQTK